MLSRSPFYVTAPLNFSQTTGVKLSLFIYTGDKVTDKPATPQVEKLIQRATASQAFIDVDIATFVRDFIEVNFQTFTTGVKPSLETDSVWVDWVIEYQDTVNSIADITGSTLGLYGYTKYLDGAQTLLTDKVLLSGIKRVAHKGLLIVPFINDGTFTSVDGITLTADDTNTNRLSYFVKDIQADTSFTFAGANPITINVELLPDTKYTPKIITFVNRFGVLEQIPFSLVSKETVSVNGKQFKNNLVTSGTYNVNRHLTKDINRNGQELVQLNTDFLPESYNETIEQLLMSEQVWLDGLPVNVKSASIEKKTKINDSLISYTIEVSRAYHLMNDV